MKKEFIGLIAVHFNSVLGWVILSAFSGLSSIKWDGCLPYLEATQQIWHYSLIHGCLLCLKFFCG